MSHTPFLQAVTVEGKEIQRIVFDRLQPAIEGENFEESIMSLLIFAILLMKPEIELEALQEVVLSTTEHIMMHISVPEGPAN